MPDAPPIERVRVSAYRVPTERPESDGTLRWDSTTMVAVHVDAGATTGFGYTYAESAAGAVIQSVLADRIIRRDAMDIPARLAEMIGVIRNNGDCGLCRMAVAAVEAALWDLKGKLLNLPLCRLLGMARDEVRAYGSGGFTSYTLEQLREQLGGWAAEGFGAVKMKIGRDAGADRERLSAARDAIGSRTALFADANGAYSPRQALSHAAEMQALGVVWFEEPVAHQDVEGTAFVRRGAPPGMAVSVGEYAFGPADFLRLLRSDAVDVLMADATRCGISAFMLAGALCEAWRLPLSSHCAPSLHLHPCLSSPPLVHMEYFHDHVRLEHRLLDGAATAHDGLLRPDLARPGLGVELKTADAKRYEV